MKIGGIIEHGFPILANHNISVWTISYNETEWNLQNMQSDYVISSRDTSRVAINRKTVSPPWQIAGAHGLKTQKRAWRPVQNEKSLKNGTNINGS